MKNGNWPIEKIFLLTAVKAPSRHVGNQGNEVQHRPQSKSGGLDCALLDLHFRSVRIQSGVRSNEERTMTAGDSLKGRSSWYSSTLVMAPWMLEMGGLETLSKYEANTGFGFRVLGKPAVFFSIALEARARGSGRG